MAEQKKNQRPPKNPESPRKPSGEKLIAENKKARHDFFITDTYEAGLVLTGSEVKALRDSAVTFKDSYISFQRHEAFWQNAHIGVYKQSSYNNHEPERLRKLLLNKPELSKIHSSMKEKGLSCIPLKIYFKNGRAKLLIGMAKGKKKGDKREDSKTRDVAREMHREIRKSRE